MSFPSAAYHSQVEAESPGSCELLEREERAAREDTLAERSRAIIVEARDLLQVAGAGNDAEPSPPPLLAAAICERILNDPRSEATGHDGAADPSTAAATFFAQALRGARSGYVARRAGDAAAWPAVAEANAPPDGAARAAWLFGFEVATTTPEPERPAVQLNDELREYARRYLAYRAPEQLTARDRLILAAFDAEQSAAAAKRGAS